MRRINLFFKKRIGKHQIFNYITNLCDTKKSVKVRNSVKNALNIIDPYPTGCFYYPKTIEKISLESRNYET